MGVGSTSCLKELLYELIFITIIRKCNIVYSI